MRKAPVVLLVLSLFAFLPATASAAELPGGKANFVVALGSFKAGTDNWVRLGSYEFSSAGTVTARTHLWWQREPVARQGTGTTPDHTCSTSSVAPGQTLVRDCQVLTAGGFMSAPGETRTGSYEVDGGVLHITWNIGQTWTEQWTVTSSSDNKLVRLDYRFNTLATAGYAYGSNASLSTRRQMASVQSFPGTLRLDFRGWDHGNLTSHDGVAYNIAQYKTCSTTSWCLTYLLPEAVSACRSGCVAGSTDTSIQNHIVRVSNNDRRDTHWQWCSCLTKRADGTDEKCYTRNSHVKPMMQILDDDGQFRGWVGTEASFNPVTPNPRDGDMLSAFRVSDFR
ncbi:hypothetical protein [Lentzea sp.]|uniref:hypothetical protein n=1 Tax=Lentzea sp. TaxID=56099 RepID=UPI002BA1DD82|nr:hypothetical protein [Lentzea sp.]HUQ56633.1 hypothetical protein [Lentzea sp.]